MYQVALKMVYFLANSEKYKLHNQVIKKYNFVGFNKCVQN
jgi:hypothetical protein